MEKTTYIIADLHLTSSRPHLFKLFEHFMKEIAPLSEQLYVLGDLFDVWIGDDCLENSNPNSELYTNTISLFNNYCKSNKQLYFMHGNRDFLLGHDFANATGGKILDEPFITQFGKSKLALLHGDILCTDDVAYQNFRKMVRNLEWQNEFLSYPIFKRMEIASSLREQSKESQMAKTNEIMDVNAKSVESFYIEHNIDYLIHGHTHRQALHTLNINDKERKRYVLSDWADKGFYLSLDNHSVSENYFSLN